MIKFLLTLLVMFFFSACSFKSEPNEWAYKSSNAFGSYTKNFLSGNDTLAKHDLKRAIHHAKSSADLTQLARIYLGACALNISVGIDDKCLEYQNISDLVNDKSLSSYYALIRSSLVKEDIQNLTPKYQEFAQNVLESKYDDAKQNIFDAKVISSKMIGGSLIQKELSNDDVEKLIDAASFYGYRKSVVFWLKVQKSKTQDDAKIKIIEKKIKVLE